MQTKHICVLILIQTKGEVGTPLNRFNPSSKTKILTVPRRCFFCGSFMLFLSCFVMLSCTSVRWCLVVTCFERADLLALILISICDVVTFPLISWVRCVAWLYQFLILVLFLTLFGHLMNEKFIQIGVFPQGKIMCWKTRSKSFKHQLSEMYLLHEKAKPFSFHYAQRKPSFPLI